jgi:type II secretory pathway component PulF
VQFLSKIIHTLSLGGFRAKRDEFYELMARSYDNKEAFRDFLTEELKIATSAKTKDASRAYALKIVRNRLAAGDQSKFSQLLGTVMPASDKMMLAALDDAPDKAALMRTLATAVRDQRQLMRIVKGKLLPPLLILPGAFAFAYVMATKSLPVVVRIAPPEVWSAFNMAVRVFAEYIANHSGKTILAVLAALVVFTYQLPRWTGPLRSKLEGIKPGVAALLFPVCPILLPLSIYRDVQAGLMFSALSVMLQAGRTLNDALATIRNNSQPWMRWHVRRILAHLELRPTEYSRAFSKGLISARLLARMSSQIRTNPRFDQVLIKLGSEGGAEIRAEVEKQTSRVNAMLLAAGGFTVAFMMIGQLSIGQTMTEEMSPQKQMQKRLMRQQGLLK